MTYLETCTFCLILRQLIIWIFQARAFYGFQIAMENIHSGMVLYAEKYGLGQSQMFSVLISLQSLKISLRKRMKTSLAKIDNVYMEMPTLLRSVSSHMVKNKGLS